MKRPTSALLLTLAGLTAAATLGSAPSSAVEPWGHAASGNHTLKQGCHSYPYRYRVRPPSGDWMAELSLLNPSGRSIASETLVYNVDDRSGVRNWRVCSTSTRIGVHTITMKVTSTTDGRSTTQRLAPTTFRFSPAH